MNKQSRAIISSVIAIAGATTGHAAGQIYFENFESYELGQSPGGGWQSTNARIDNPTTPSPNAVVIDTIGADGRPTQAIQVVDAIGTSSGIVRDVKPVDFQQFQMDVRIDQFSNASGSWPGGIGFLKDEGADDFNRDPQAVLYAWEDRRWHLFIKNSDSSQDEAVDIVIPGLPPIELGRWYTLYLDANSETGRFTAAVYDGATRQLLNGVILDYPDWNPEFGRFDAVAAFDGEDANSSGTLGGVSTYDNAYYIPSPSAAFTFGSGLLVLSRRRRHPTAG